MFELAHVTNYISLGSPPMFICYYIPPLPPSPPTHTHTCTHTRTHARTHAHICLLAYTCTYNCKMITCICVYIPAADPVLAQRKAPVSPRLKVIVIRKYGHIIESLNHTGVPTRGSGGSPPMKIFSGLFGSFLVQFGGEIRSNDRLSNIAVVPRLSGCIIIMSMHICLYMQTVEQSTSACI